MKQSTLYWLCQTVGWGVYTLFSIGMLYIFAGTENMTTDGLVLQLIIAVTLLLFSHFFRLFMKAKAWTQLSVKALLPKLVVGVLAVSVLSQALIHLLIYVLLPLKQIAPFSWVGFIGYAGNVAVVLAAWSLIYFSYQFSQRNRRSEVEKLELKSALQEAELAILKNQINPHFLFNALNNIRSLILSDPEKARSMVTHISELLRYSIQFNAAEKVTLGQEIAIVKDYLQLESIQFNNRLTYAFDIDDESLDVKIPPMAIQLLVENAIKHGVSQLTAGGDIRIKSVLENDHLRIEVCNDGQLKAKSKREGIGLKNLIERLQILFGHFAELKVENSSENTVTASLKIPLS